MNLNRKDKFNYLRRSAIKFFFFNALLIFNNLVSVTAVSGGGTGDRTEGFSLIYIYLIVSLVVFFTYGICSLGMFSKKITAVFILLIAVLILSFFVYNGIAFRDSSGNYDPGVLTHSQEKALSASLLFLIIEVFIFELFSIALSIACIILRLRFSILVLILNISMLLIYVYMIFNGIIQWNIFNKSFSAMQII